jgi:hypothetical protein
VAQSLRVTCLYGVHCRCSCVLIAKEELNIFSVGLSPDQEAEEKMVRRGEGLESEMRNRHDLRRQARTVFFWPTTLLEQKYDTPLVEAEYPLEAISADRTVAEPLRIAQNSPIFLIERDFVHHRSHAH